MGQNPAETAEQWCARVTVRYLDAREALSVERNRLGFDDALPLGVFRQRDKAYRLAMDDVDAADHERIEALIALDLNRRPR